MPTIRRRAPIIRGGQAGPSIGQAIGPSMVSAGGGLLQRYKQRRDADQEAQAIEDYLGYFSKAMIESGKNEKTVGVYKSNVKRILKLAINHKDEVIKLGENAGNLNQWYNACGEAKPAERNKNPKVTTPKPTDAPKLGEEDKKPSDQRDYVKEFHDSAKVMLESGMTAKQLHAVIDELAKQMTAKAA